MRVCSVEGCNEKYCAKGFCRKHYKRFLREQERNKKPKKEEKKCSIEGCDKPHSCKGLCSYHYKRKRDGAKQTKEERENRKCSVPNCNEKHLAKGYCAFHYWQHHNKEDNRRKNLREIQKRYSKTEKGKATNKKYAETDKGKISLKNGRKRRKARIRGASVENFNFWDVYERDFFVCSICGHPINPLLQHPDPLAVTLEHIFPISKGGTHSVKNCAPAHGICNTRKGAKILQPNFDGASI